MYIDFDPDTLFGVADVADPVAASSCGFTTKNEKKVAEYLDHLE
jgi:hypothetical protein